MLILCCSAQLGLRTAFTQRFFVAYFALWLYQIAKDIDNEKEALHSSNPGRSSTASQRNKQLLLLKNMF
jgi:hypothetical protein